MGSVEKILALRPDIVAGVEFVSQAMARLRLWLERFPIDTSVTGSEARVRRLVALPEDLIALPARWVGEPGRRALSMA